MTPRRPTTLSLLALASALALAACATAGGRGPSGPYVSGGAGYARH